MSDIGLKRNNPKDIQFRVHNKESLRGVSD